MATALDIIRRALRAIGALGSGAVPTGTEAEDCRQALNSMLAQWEKRRLTVYCLMRTAFPHLAGVQTYTLGAGATWDVPRPARIVAAALEIASTDPPQEAAYHLLTEQEYIGLVLKTQAATAPYALYYQPAMPAGIVTLYPVPSAAGTTVLYLEAVLQRFPTVATVVNLPPEYEEALWSNLALRLQPEFPGGELSPLVASIAADSLATVRALNHRTPQVLFDPALVHVHGGSGGGGGAFLQEDP